MTYKDKSTFPTKKCLIATVVIIICFLMVLALLSSIVFSTEISEYAYIFFIVWGIALFLSLLSYWLYQVYRFIKTRKDETKKEHK